MSKEEFELKVKEVQKAVYDLCLSEGVYSATSLYGFLRSAEMAMGMAVLCADDYHSDDLIEVSLNYDEERKADFGQSL